jgi:hypothetical protein
MDNSACLSGSERLSRLGYDLESEVDRQRAFSQNSRLKRFAFDQFHGIKAVAILFTIMKYTGDVGMAKLGGSACLTDKTGSRLWMIRDTYVDNFQRDRRVKHSVPTSVGCAHRTMAQLDGLTQIRDGNFKMPIPS